MHAWFKHLNIKKENDNTDKIHFMGGSIISTFHGDQMRIAINPEISGSPGA